LVLSLQGGEPHWNTEVCCLPYTGGLPCCADPQADASTSSRKLHHYSLCRSTLSIQRSLPNSLHQVHALAHPLPPPACQRRPSLLPCFFPHTSKHYPAAAGGGQLPVRDAAGGAAGGARHAPARHLPAQPHPLLQVGRVLPLTGHLLGLWCVASRDMLMLDMSRLLRIPQAWPKHAAALFPASLETAPPTLSFHPRSPSTHAATGPSALCWSWSRITSPHQRRSALISWRFALLLQGAMASYLRMAPDKK